MNTLHLIWIVPLCATFGFSICAILNMSKDDKY